MQEKTQKDVLYNHVIKKLKTEGVGFTPIQVDTTGKTVVQTLTSVLWFMDGRHDRFEARAVTLPSMFQTMRGFRNYKDQHQKVPDIAEEQLQEQINKLGDLLLLPWILNSKFSQFKGNVDMLLQGLQKYQKFLHSMKTRVKQNRASTSRVRNLNESWVLKVIESSEEDERYNLLVHRLNNINQYEPIDLCDLEPSNKEERRKWLTDMKVPFPITVFTYRYGNYLGNLNMVWKIPVHIRERKTSVECKLVQDIIQQIPKYKTRRMQKDFVVRYNMFAKPVVLRNMFQYLTEFECTPENMAEADIDLRFCETLLHSEDTELIFDLRKNNGRPLTKEFDAFWTELDKYLTEKSVVHERRHNDINYMPFAMSVEDLRDIIKERLPNDSKVPSVSWLKLNFCPSNPYKNSAKNYTGRFKVKFKVQQRLLRAQHEDSEFGRNQFSHLKEFSCKYKSVSLLQSVDDKAIVPIGEPGHAVSTGVRPHHGSFYNGLVHVTVKDKVFEASSPMRQLTENIALLRHKYCTDGVNLDKPILIRYSDGGPDHRVTYRSVQLCSLVEFIALDLDMIVCARTAPSMSYLNPAERTMSLLNIGLQNVSLRRENMAPEFELLARGKTLKGLRNIAERNEKFKEKYKESTNVPIEILKQRFRKLKWRGESVVVNEAATEVDINTVTTNMLKVLDGDVQVDPGNLTKLKSQKIDEFLQKHSRRRHYIFQIKKCGEDSCAYCVLNPPRLHAEEFEELHFVPDPTCDETGYKSFSEIYGTETDDSGRPSLTFKPQATERDTKFKKLFVGNRVRGYVICCQCGKRRVVYAEKRLSSPEEMALKRVQEELLYVCGSVLFPGGVHQDSVLVKEGLSCSSPIEVTYYAGKTVTFDSICYHCGDTELEENNNILNLKEQYGIVRPICRTCIDNGKTIVTRNALKVK